MIHFRGGVIVKDTGSFSALTKTEVNPVKNQILSTDPDNLLQLLPMLESAGATVVEDVSGNGFNGTPTNVTFGATAAPGGVGTSPQFAVGSDIDAYSAGLAAAWDVDITTSLIFVKVLNAGIWTDGTARNALFPAFSPGSAVTGRSTVNNQLRARLFGGGGISEVLLNGISTLDWFMLVYTHSFVDNKVEFFYNGASVGVDTRTKWTDPLISFSICANWVGYGAMAATWKSILTPTQISDIWDSSQ